MKTFHSSQLLVVLVLIVLISGVLAARYFYSKDDGKNIFIIRPEYVYELRGEIEAPGFYSFYGEQTIEQLMDTCGSLTEKIESSGLSKKIKNGTRVILTDKIKIESLEASARINFFLPIDINTASIEDLTLIPGVGRKTAESIACFRDKHNGISDLYELINVKGIGEKRLNRILPYLSIDS